MDHQLTRVSTVASTCAYPIILHSFHGHKLHLRASHADLARRKSGVQIPSPPPRLLLTAHHGSRVGEPSAFWALSSASAPWDVQGIQVST
jgi:hypothetical protein